LIEDIKEENLQQVGWRILEDWNSNKITNHTHTMRFRDELKHQLPSETTRIGEQPKVAYHAEKYSMKQARMAIIQRI
jgi:hypothetical protein